MELRNSFEPVFTARVVNCRDLVAKRRSFLRVISLQGMSLNRKGAQSHYGVARGVFPLRGFPDEHGIAGTLGIGSGAAPNPDISTTQVEVGTAR